MLRSRMLRPSMPKWARASAPALRFVEFREAQRQIDLDDLAASPAEVIEQRAQALAKARQKR